MLSSPLAHCLRICAYILRRVISGPQNGAIREYPQRLLIFQRPNILQTMGQALQRRSGLSSPRSTPFLP